MLFTETSAKTGSNINVILVFIRVIIQEAFYITAFNIIDKIKKGEIDL